MRHSLIKGSLWLALGSLVFVGCEDDGDDDPAGFIADASSFDGYRSWTQVDYTIDASNGLGGAHMGNQADFHRRIFAYGNPSAQNGEYPEGTILVKETFNHDASGSMQYADQGGLLAMVKRGAGFNPGAGDWEWFMLSNDASEIMVRGGAEVMDGACNSCHSAATTYDGLDHVFKHPSESVVELSGILADYSSWAVVDEVTGDHDFLNAAHGGADATRKVFKNTLHADPNPAGSSGDMWPTGTVFVKEVWQDGVLNDARTAMVKRGGSFDPAGDGWEYFMFSGDGTVLAQGGSETSCAGCHSHANSSEGYGRDWVFHHASDPMNQP